MAQNGYYIRKFGRTVNGKDVLTSLPFVTEMAIQMMVEAERVRMMYNKTTTTWNTRPYFYINLNRYKANPPFVQPSDFYSKQINQRTISRIIKSEHEAKIESMIDFANRMVQSNSNSFVFIVYTDYRIYAFVDGGTEKRYALMSDDWESKTIPGILEPGAGEGIVELYGEGFKKVFGNNPRLGIEARNFSKQIYDIENPMFRRDMYNASRRAARRMAKYLGWTEGKVVSHYIKYGRF